MTKVTVDSEPSRARTLEGPEAFAAAVAFLFLAFGLVTILNHEMWRDELQAWLIAKDSASLTDLARNMRYDGHPPLWYLLLYAVSRFTVDPVAMQLLHLAVATTAAYTFARFAPFTRTQRALFCFGYFPAYEYAALSRNYALGVLCVFAFCAAYRAGAAKNYALLALLLALLANTSAYGFMLASAFALMLAYELKVTRDDARAALRARRFEIIGAALIFFAGAAVSAAQMYPPADSGNVLGWYFNLSPPGIMFVLTIVWRGFVPVPQFTHQLWNTNVVESEALAALLACIILAATSLALARRRVALVAYLFGTGAILLFTFTKFHGSARHHGHVYVFFVACLWIAARLPAAEGLTRPLFERLSARLAGVGRKGFNALLVVHVLVAVALAVSDWRHPFSRSREVADFVLEERAGHAVIVGGEDAHVSPVTAYLQRSIYYPRGDREGTFIVWDRDWRFWPPHNLVESARRKAAERGEGVLVISTYKLDREGAARRVAEFTGSITDENYYVYIVEPETATKGGETRPSP